MKLFIVGMGQCATIFGVWVAELKKNIYCNMYNLCRGLETKITFTLSLSDGSASYANPEQHIVPKFRDTAITSDSTVKEYTTNTFVNNGYGHCSLTLTEKEMGAERIVVYIVDQSRPKMWLDQTIIIETYAPIPKTNIIYDVLSVRRKIFI